MYPSDLTDVQWATLEPLLKPPRGPRHAGGRPRKYGLRRGVGARLFVGENGGHGGGRASERIGKTLREQGRKAQGRNATPSVAIIDSQSVKTALKGGGAV